MDIEVVREHMYFRIHQCFREQRKPRHFEVAPEMYLFLKSKADPKTSWLYPVNPKEPRKLQAFGVPILVNDGWSWGWQLFDTQLRPVDDEAVSG